MEKLIVIIVAIIFTSIAYFSLSSYLDLPIVQKSYATKECVDVLPVGECKNLPKKYLVEWVR